jgi:hypothetical protein
MNRRQLNRAILAMSRPDIDQAVAFAKRMLEDNGFDTRHPGLELTNVFRAVIALAKNRRIGRK